jgi:hypothetical protein
MPKPIGKRSESHLKNSDPPEGKARADLSAA